MGSVGALGLLHSISDAGVALNEVGLATVGDLLGGSNGLPNNSNIVSIDLVCLEFNDILTLNDVLGLGVFG